MRAGEVGLHGHGVWLMLHKCQGSPSPGEETGVGERTDRKREERLERECSLRENNMVVGP